MNLELTDYQVLIIGGTKGIGLSIAKSFLLEGAVVHVISRNNMNHIRIELEKNYPSNIYFYQSDATIEDSLNHTYPQILQNSKNKIDILIANVGNGTGVLDPVPNKEDWDSSWNINFNSALNSIRVFSEKISESNGAITFISSIAGIEYIGAPISYSTAKTALIAFSKSLSHKLAPSVRVNVVAPGNILVENGTWDKKMKTNPEFITSMINEKVPLKRFGLPDEISNFVLFISSPKASFITGGCFVIDGGQTTSF
jgi:3-oxoacyl-[acyl-carrier protein] reductase